MTPRPGASGTTLKLSMSEAVEFLEDPAGAGRDPWGPGA